MFRESLLFPLTSCLLKPKVPLRTVCVSLAEAGRRSQTLAFKKQAPPVNEGREGAALRLERRTLGVGEMVVHGCFCAKGNVCAEPIQRPWALSPLSRTLTVAASHSPFTTPLVFTLQLGRWMYVSVLNRPQRGCWNKNVCLAGREKTVWFKCLIELQALTIAVIVAAF